MSATFSQICALIDRNCKSNSSTYTIADKTADINLALDSAWALIFGAGGKWQYDDTNQTDYPIITTNLIAGQRDYAFVTDQQGNLILDIYKVVIAQPNGTFVDIIPVDVQSEKNTAGFYNGKDVQGTPTKYDKTANAIFLDAIPNYTIAGGLKVYINREGSYFTVSDTTKKAGFAGLFHEYLALRPSYYFAFRNTLKNTQNLLNELLKMEAKILAYYGKRDRDTRQAMRPNVESTK